MYKKVITTISLLILLVVAAFIWRYYEIRQNEERLRLAREAANAGIVSTSTAELPTVATSTVTLYETSIQHKTDMFESVSVSAGDTLPTGTVVKGSVRGNWYFEASFPVEIKVGATTIWSGVATAGADWMTTNFVPFTFTPVYTPFGTPTNAVLILKKDNPSGEPINDDELQIAIVAQ
jgi:hypothetical protein